MATKRNGVACYDKAGEDEPLFVLRAQDVLAAKVVRYWAALAATGSTNPEVIREAPRVRQGHGGVGVSQVAGHFTNPPPARFHFIV